MDTSLAVLRFRGADRLRRSVSATVSSWACQQIGPARSYRASHRSRCVPSSQPPRAQGEPWPRCSVVPAYRGCVQQPPTATPRDQAGGAASARRSLHDVSTATVRPADVTVAVALERRLALSVMTFRRRRSGNRRLIARRISPALGDLSLSSSRRLNSSGVGTGWWRSHPARNRLATSSRHGPSGRRTTTSGPSWRAWSVASA